MRMLDPELPETGTPRPTAGVPSEPAVLEYRCQDPGCGGRRLEEAPGSLGGDNGGG